MNIEELAYKISEKLGYKIATLIEKNHGEVGFWVPWEHTGAWATLEKAKNDCLAMNEKEEVIWCWSIEDMKELLENN